MTQTIKLSIQHENGTNYGPYHWKHIIEWNEFELINNYKWVDNQGVLHPISELLSTIGVPPTICTNGILHVPMHSGHGKNPEALRMLKVLGFPTISGSVGDDLGRHLVKRLRMTDDELNAEDPDFDTTGLEVITALLPELPTSSSTPDIMTEKPENAEDAEAAETTAAANESASEQAAPQQAAPEQSAPRREIPEQVATDTSVNPFFEGEEVSAHESTEDYTPIIKKGPSKLPFIIIALLVIAAGGGVFVAMQAPEDSSPKESPTEEATSKPSEEMETSDSNTPVEASVEAADETVEVTVDEVSSGSQEAVKDMAETVEETVAELPNEVTNALDNAITPQSDEAAIAAEETLDASIVEAISEVQGEDDASHGATDHATSEHGDPAEVSTETEHSEETTDSEHSADSVDGEHGESKADNSEHTDTDHTEETTDAAHGEVPTNTEDTSESSESTIEPEASESESTL